MIWLQHQKKFRKSNFPISSTSTGETTKKVMDIRPSTPLKLRSSKPNCSNPSTSTMKEECWIAWSRRLSWLESVQKIHTEKVLIHVRKIFQKTTKCSCPYSINKIML